MKFAYMIMAHHRFDVLKELLIDLDDERNDIFIHIDNKAGDISKLQLEKVCNKAKVFFTKRINVYWGNRSQIECETILLEAATEHGYHDYYHLLVGVEFPIRSQDYINNFLKNNYGKEFIGFSPKANSVNRIQYYHLWTNCLRNKNKVLEFTCNTFEFVIFNFQKAIKINRLKHSDDYYKKGNTTFSITDECARYVLSKKDEYLKACKYSYCADEIFLQTVVYNSKFYKNVYDVNNEERSSIRIAQWGNSKNQYNLCDLNTLLSSEALFARKIDGEDAIELINEIKRLRK